ncbi:MAG: DUF2975 domain-containing protein [Lachnospiraceae bacterium]|nr:DUF2975 domain-containing protein [Lachnospiraceae bacterium]
MKNEVVSKINTVGKVGSIITLIVKILCGIGFAGAMIAGIFLLIMPKDFVSINIDATAGVIVDLAEIGITPSLIGDLDIEEGERLDLETGTYVYTTTDIEQDGTKISVSASAETVQIRMREFAWVSFLGALSVAMFFVVLLFVGKLCKAFAKCDNPFEENIIHRMKQLAISIIPMVVISWIVDAIGAFVMSGYTEFKMTFDFGSVLIVVVILVLTYVFKYGAVLQQESDETL